MAPASCFGYLVFVCNYDKFFRGRKKKWDLSSTGSSLKYNNLTNRLKPGARNLTPQEYRYPTSWAIICSSSNQKLWQGTESKHKLKCSQAWSGMLRQTSVPCSLSTSSKKAFRKYHWAKKPKFINLVREMNIFTYILRGFSKEDIHRKISF